MDKPAYIEATIDAYVIEDDAGLFVPVVTVTVGGTVTRHTSPPEEEELIAQLVATAQAYSARTTLDRLTNL